MSGGGSNYYRNYIAPALALGYQQFTSTYDCPQPRNTHSYEMATSYRRSRPRRRRFPIRKKGFVPRSRGFTRRGRRRYRTGAVTTKDKDYAITRFRPSSRAVQKRYKKRRFRKMMGQLLDTKSKIFTQAARKDTYFLQAYCQNWQFFTVGDVSDLDTMVNYSKEETVGDLAVDAGDVVPGNRYTYTYKSYIKSLHWEIRCCCFTPVLTYTGDGKNFNWNTSAVSDVEGNVTVPMIFDVYEFVGRSSMLAEDYDEIQKLFSTGGGGVLSATNVADGYGARDAAAGDKHWGSNPEITPLDYKGITKYWSLRKKSRFVVKPGDHFDYSGTEYYNKVYSKSKLNYLTRRGFTKLIMVCMYQANNEAAPVLPGSISGKASLVLEKHYSFKPVTTSTIGTVQ